MKENEKKTVAQWLQMVDGRRDWWTNLDGTKPKQKPKSTMQFINDDEKKGDRHDKNRARFLKDLEAIF